MSNIPLKKQGGMTISTDIFCWLVGGYLAGMSAMFYCILELFKTKSSKREVESLEKRFLSDVNRIRDNVQQIYGATKENKATLNANRDTLKLILDRLPARS